MSILSCGFWVLILFVRESSGGIGRGVGRSGLACLLPHTFGGVGIGAGGLYSARQPTWFSEVGPGLRISEPL